jgi:hypothetical protein
MGHTGKVREPFGAVVRIWTWRQGHYFVPEKALHAYFRCAFHQSEALSLSRLNYQWPECEVHPEMMAGVTARHLCVQRGLKGCNETLQLVHSHPDESQERGRAGLQASARSTSQRGGGLLASEAS